MFLLKSVNRLLCNTRTAVNSRFCSDILQNAKSGPILQIQNLLEKWKNRFEQESIPEVDSSLKNIFAHVLAIDNLEKIENLQNVEITEEQLNKIEELCECRLLRMPVQYIIGEWDFRDLTLKMIPPVFIPRPETEELVELILQQVDMKQPIRFLEIGSGTGAISLSILNSLPNATSVALDQNKLACELTMFNANSLNVSDRLRVFKHKLTDEDLPKEIVGEQFDVIVSNPPYVPTKKLHELEPEVKIYEDLRALDGGPDGLNVVKSILKLSSKHLKKGGVLWLEVDASHAELLEKYLADNDNLGLKFVASYKDIFHNDRFVEIIRI